MAEVQGLVRFIATSEASDSGTDGDVYLGIGGREFYLDTPRDDFERGELVGADMGVYSQVQYPDMNDPRTPYQLRTEDLDRFPVYLRFDGDDHWKLLIAVVWVLVGPDIDHLEISDSFVSHLGYTDDQGGLWLGRKAGRWLHLRRGGGREVRTLLQSANRLDAANRLLRRRAPRSAIRDQMP